MRNMVKAGTFAVLLVIVIQPQPAQADIWCLRDLGSSGSGACVFPSAQDCAFAARMSPFGGACQRQPLESQDRRDQQRDRRTTGRQVGNDRW
jgi:hypothetical protein